MCNIVTFSLLMGQHKNKASLNGVSLMPNDNSDTQGSNFPLFVACNLPWLLMSGHMFIYTQIQLLQCL